MTQPMATPTIDGRQAPSQLLGRDVLGLGTAGLRIRRGRTILTAAGIAIGIAAMVGVLGIGASSRADLLLTLDRLGTNLLKVSPGQSLLAGPAVLPASAPSMIRRLGGVDAVATIAPLQGTVRRTDLIPSLITNGINLAAADTNLVSTVRGSMSAGRFLDAATEQYPAIVLGASTARRLGIDRVGVAVWVTDRWFTVIGIMTPVALAPELDSSALIGYPEARATLDPDAPAGQIYIRASESQISAVRELLAPTSNPQRPNEVSVSRPSDAIAARAAAAASFANLLAGLAAIALIVGGVGVANVMLMAVLERRSEIGLRRALGATRRHIIVQFLAESVALAGLGGAIGIASGAAMTAAYATSRGWTVTLPIEIVGGGLLAAILVGATAGLYPARQAASVDPTTALRSL